VKPTLKTPRMTLRAVTDDDVTALWELDQDPLVRRYVKQPLAPTLDQVRDEVLPRWRAFDRDTPALGYWVAVYEGEVVGWFHLRPPRPGSPADPGDLELGYRLVQRVWGLGLATEGSAELVRYGFAELAAPRVTATALAPNGASIRVMRKVGMRWLEDWMFGEDPAVRYGIDRPGP
jgi:RimJ/RimL family protein N-acetyltransferase